MTEYEKMIAGKIYDPMDDELDAMRNHTDKLCLRYNALPVGSPERTQIIDELFPDHGDEPYLRGPIYFDYGINTHLGNHVYANFNFVVLDVCPVYIGDFTLFGPNVSIYTALHPMVAEQRRLFYRPEQKKWVDIEYGKPIYIGKDCWFGGGVTILPGVHIGDGCVIGAGSVVTKDIPAHSLAHGSPCRVIRQITEKDRLNPELFVE